MNTQSPPHYPVTLEMVKDYLLSLSSEGLGCACGEEGIDLIKRVAEWKYGPLNPIWMRYGPSHGWEELSRNFIRRVFDYPADLQDYLDVIGREVSEHPRQYLRPFSNALFDPAHPLGPDNHLWIQALDLLSWLRVLSPGE